SHGSKGIAGEPEQPVSACPPRGEQPSPSAIWAGHCGKYQTCFRKRVDVPSQSVSRPPRGRRQRRRCFGYVSNAFAISLVIRHHPPKSARSINCRPACDRTLLSAVEVDFVRGLTW